MEKLVRLFILLAFALAVSAYVAPTASAQGKMAGGKTTVTGCLQKGDEPGEYSITGEDGETYGLRSKAVNLSQHLGHKVERKQRSQFSNDSRLATRDRQGFRLA